MAGLLNRLRANPTKPSNDVPYLHLKFTAGRPPQYANHIPFVHQLPLFKQGEIQLPDGLATDVQREGIARYLLNNFKAGTPTHGVVHERPGDAGLYLLVTNNWHRSAGDNKLHLSLYVYRDDMHIATWHAYTDRTISTSKPEAVQTPTIEPPRFTPKPTRVNEEIEAPTVRLDRPAAAPPEEEEPEIPPPRFQRSERNSADRNSLYQQRQDFYEPSDVEPRQRDRLEPPGSGIQPVHPRSPLAPPPLSPANGYTRSSRRIKEDEPVAAPSADWDAPPPETDAPDSPDDSWMRPPPSDLEEEFNPVWNRDSRGFPEDYAPQHPSDYHQRNPRNPYPYPDQDDEPRHDGRHYQSYNQPTTHYHEPEGEEEDIYAHSRPQSRAARSRSPSPTRERKGTRGKSMADFEKEVEQLQSKAQAALEDKLKEIERRAAEVAEREAALLLNEAKSKRSSKKIHTDDDSRPPSRVVRHEETDEESRSSRKKRSTRNEEEDSNRASRASRESRDKEDSEHREHRSSRRDRDRDPEEKRTRRSRHDQPESYPEPEVEPEPEEEPRERRKSRSSRKEREKSDDEAFDTTRLHPSRSIVPTTEAAPVTAKAAAAAIGGWFKGVGDVIQTRTAALRAGAQASKPAEPVQEEDEEEDPEERRRRKAERRERRERRRREREARGELTEGERTDRERDRADRKSRRRERDNDTAYEQTENEEEDSRRLQSLRKEKEREDRHASKDLDRRHKKKDYDASELEESEAPSHHSRAPSKSDYEDEYTDHHETPVRKPSRAAKPILDNEFRPPARKPSRASAPVTSRDEESEVDQREHVRASRKPSRAPPKSESDDEVEQEPPQSKRKQSRAVDVQEEIHRPSKHEYDDQEESEGPLAKRHADASERQGIQHMYEQEYERPVRQQSRGPQRPAFPEDDEVEEPESFVKPQRVPSRAPSRAPPESKSTARQSSRTPSRKAYDRSEDDEEETPKPLRQPSRAPSRQVYYQPEEDEEEPAPKPAKQFSRASSRQTYRSEDDEIEEEQAPQPARKQSRVAPRNPYQDEEEYLPVSLSESPLIYGRESSKPTKQSTRGQPPDVSPYTSDPMRKLSLAPRESEDVYSNSRDQRRAPLNIESESEDEPVEAPAPSMTSKYQQNPYGRYDQERAPVVDQSELYAMQGQVVDDYEEIPRSRPRGSSVSAKRLEEDSINQIDETKRQSQRNSTFVSPTELKRLEDDGGVRRDRRKDEYKDDYEEVRRERPSREDRDKESRHRDKLKPRRHNDSPEDDRGRRRDEDKSHRNRGQSRSRKKADEDDFAQEDIQEPMTIPTPARSRTAAQKEALGFTGPLSVREELRLKGSSKPSSHRSKPSIAIPDRSHMSNFLGEPIRGLTRSPDGFAPGESSSNLDKAFSPSAYTQYTHEAVGPIVAEPEQFEEVRSRSASLKGQVESDDDNEFAFEPQFEGKQSTRSKSSKSSRTKDDYGRSGWDKDIYGQSKGRSAQHSQIEDRPHLHSRVTSFSRTAAPLSLTDGDDDDDDEDDDDDQGYIDYSFKQPPTQKQLFGDLDGRSSSRASHVSSQVSSNYGHNRNYASEDYASASSSIKATVSPAWGAPKDSEERRRKQDSGRERERDRRDLNRDRDGERHRERDRERDRDRGGDRERDHDRDRRDRDRDRVRDRGDREKDYERDRGGDRRRDRERDSDRRRDDRINDPYGYSRRR